MTNWASVYEKVSLCRAFELAVEQLWNRGFISGEMHLGTGEEVVTAAVIAQLTADDAVAADHRSSPPFVMRGVDLVQLFGELLGDESGLCRGRGGHMHLFERDPLTVSSGIVGAGAPSSAGFALAAQQLRPGSIAVGFFGDGAVNQGMVMESLNLAAAWDLPVLFVCKDNEWAITTKSAEVTGGTLRARFAGFGLLTWEVDGTDVRASCDVMSKAVGHARRGEPGVVVASVPRLHGHLLGYMAVRIADHLSAREAIDQVGKSMKALAGTGGSLLRRTGGLITQMKTLMQTRGEKTGGRADPVDRARKVAKSEGVDVDATDERSVATVEAAMARALTSAGVEA